MKPSRAKPLILFLFVGVCFLCEAQPYHSQLEIRSDDDSYLFIGLDRYYTSGTFITYSFLKKEKDTKKVIESWKLGQLIFTPFAGNVNNPLDQDRPFAGYAFLERSRSYFYTDGEMLKISTGLGILGPPALGEQTQTFIHHVFGFYSPDGWQYQIKTELGLQFAVEYSMPLIDNLAKTIDLAWNNKASFSNIFCNTATGITLRAGKFGHWKNSGFYNGGSLSKQKSIGKEFFLYSKFYANCIFYDATIEGGIFDKGSPIEFRQRPFVLSSETGLQYNHQHWGFLYAVTFKTKEVYSTAFADEYGTIAVSYRF